MKPPPFDYAAPRELDEALRLLGDDAKALAGGQSLIPLLNFRLARPELIVDLNRIAGLDYLRRSDGELRIGALTRQRTLERSGLVRQHWPLLAEAVAWAGHPQTRARGTVGGSAVHADPAAELPVALTCLDATFVARSARGARTIAAGEFFAGPLTSALEPDELLVEIRVPAQAPGARAAFAEYAPTHGDFAVAGAAVVRPPAGEGAPAVGLLGAGPTPVRAPAAEEALAAGSEPSRVAELAVAGVGDEHRSALAAELVREAVGRTLS